MLRLPYFNPIRHLIVDPMHCLFLGIAKWIVKKLWIDGGKLSKSDLKLMENRAKQIKLPAVWVEFHTKFQPETDFPALQPINGSRLFLFMRFH